MNRIHIITLGVKDINRSLKFYRDGLGFKTSVTEENPPDPILLGQDCVQPLVAFLAKTGIWQSPQSEFGD
jgi:catechol 2,3-dioxygenase-like lactoylglutathione lyase family enzyme